MEDQLICIYSGSQINANFYKEILEEENIESTIRNTREESLHAGFVTDPEGTCDLFVFDQNAEKALQIIKNIEDSKSK